MDTNTGTNMFRRISADHVVSAKGFEVELISVHEIRYTEGDLIMTVEIEGGLSDFTVYTETLQSQLPADQVPSFTLEKKQIIVKNIDEALTFLGIPHVMDLNS